MSTDTPNVEDLLAKLHGTVLPVPICADKLFAAPITEIRASCYDSEALYQLGFLYYSHTGKDTKDALPWLLVSSSTNYSKADYLIGEMYNDGNGVEKDRLMSLKWHLHAARNYKDSRLKIAYLFYHGGDGVPQDNYKALEWFYAFDRGSRMIKHLNQQRNCYLKERDKNRAYKELYIETQTILTIELRKREKEKELLEKHNTSKLYRKHRKPTKYEVKNMTDCSKVLTKKEMKEVFNPFIFQPKK